MEQNYSGESREVTSQPVSAEPYTAVPQYGQAPPNAPQSPYPPQYAAYYQPPQGYTPIAPASYGNPYAQQQAVYPQGYYTQQGQYIPPGYYPVPVYYTAPPKTPDDYGFFRRAWRAIYPILIFWGTQTAAMILLLILFMILMAAFMVPNVDISSSDIVRIVIFSVSGIFLLTEVAIFAPMIPIWVKTRKWYKKFTGGRVTGSRLALTVALGFFFNLCVSVLINDIFHLQEDQSTVIELFQTLSQDIDPEATYLQYTLSMIPALAIVGPIVEELCFRGIILNRLSNRSVWLAVPIQAALFGIFHFNLVQGIYTFVLGLFLGMIYVRHKSIFYPIALHIAFNLGGICISIMPSLGIPPVILCAAAGGLSLACLIPLMIMKAAPKARIEQTAAAG